MNEEKLSASPLFSTKHTGEPGRFPWEIQLSTFPWQEGSPLWSTSDLAVDLENRRVLQSSSQNILSETFPVVREWQIIDWNRGMATLTV